MALSRLILTTIFLLAILKMSSQDNFCPVDSNLKVLTPFEIIHLKNLPLLTTPSNFASRDMPYAVDNSTQPYMRPVFNQDAYCCGQAAGIAYNYTYEVDRIRNLNASQSANQYPTHFSWNFMNGGNGWFGVSYLHSFQILKHYGTPNVTDYGGTLSFGGGKRWMSGYSEYFNGMHNRINEIMQIQAGNEEGLMTLKHWLHDHLEGSDVGGLASFYAQYMSADNVLPAGTPEAGKYVLTWFGGSPNHAMTIVGYNDSIRWDYNNDGQYTIDQDINNDGSVNMKDWEIGGLKMVQSYGGVPNWGDQGYAYMMYKTLADDLGAGGIWNHAVHVLDVKPDFLPQLTTRITLKHDRRNMIKVILGLSNDISSTQPEYRLDFPVFDYQGGNNYMQGGTAEEDKTIEFGLDISSLLTHASLDQQVKLFLEVVEQDPSGQGTGMMVDFSVFDHTGDSVLEIVCSQSNVSLVNNDTTRAYLNHYIDFDRIEILDNILPPISQGQQYSHQLTAENGSPPYYWEFDKKYDEEVSTGSFPLVDEHFLAPSNNSNGMVTQDIGFSFPFYDSTYTSITVHVDGYIMFDEQLYPYPYFIDDMTLFRITRNIAPFMHQEQTIYASSGDGIWYEGDENAAIFRWKTSYDGQGSSTEYNYAVKLYPSGEIEFLYGDMDGDENFLWISGISDGDDVNMHLTTISNKELPQSNLRVNLDKYFFPDEFELSEEGILSGIPQQPYAGIEIDLKVTDNHFISDFKTLILSSSGLLIQDSISSGGDEIIEYSETANMSVYITNLEEDTIPNASMQIMINDPYITLNDSIEELGTLLPGGTTRYEDAFEFDVAVDIPDNHMIEVSTAIHGNDTSWNSSIFYYGRSPDIRIVGTEVNDENARLDPGDTTDITINYRNYGGATAWNILALLDSDDPFVDILDNYHNIIMLEPNEEEEAIFTISADETAFNGHEALFTTDLIGDFNFIVSDTFSLVIGFQKEDFETGNFSLIHWGHGGNRDWQIDNEIFFEGSYSARSGYLTHNQGSSFFVDMDLYEDGEISFYKKVSCEVDTGNTDFDFLAFLIDSIEQERWDGETGWALHSYPVSQGYHRFEWIYEKDESVSSRMDAAWIDLITFSGLAEATPVLQYTPDEIQVFMRPDETDEIIIELFNSGPGKQDYELLISSLIEQDHPSGSRSIFGSFMTSSHQHLQTNETYTWLMRIYNTSPDNEWIKDLYIDFPPGVELIQSTDFIGGSAGDLWFEGPTGNGVTAYWHGDDGAGWGVIKGGETAEAELIVKTHNIPGEVVPINYEAHGDIYGAEPHIISGSMEMLNLGDSITWLSLPVITTGILQGGESEMINLMFETVGMEDGTYSCNLLIFDSFCDTNSIPITLVVDKTLGSDQNMREIKDDFTVFPNPSNGLFRIDATLSSADDVTISVYSDDGRLLAIQVVDPGMLNHPVTIDIRPETVSTTGGIFFIELSSESFHMTEKVVIINQ